MLEIELPIEVTLHVSAMDLEFQVVPRAGEAVGVLRIHFTDEPVPCTTFQRTRLFSRQQLVARSVR